MMNMPINNRHTISMYFSDVSSLISVIYRWHSKALSIKNTLSDPKNSKNGIKKTAETVFFIDNPLTIVYILVIEGSHPKMQFKNIISPYRIIRLIPAAALTATPIIYKAKTIQVKINEVKTCTEHQKRLARSAA